MGDPDSKEDVKNAREAVDEMFKALPKTKQASYLGHLNEVLVLLGRLRPTKD